MLHGFLNLSFGQMVIAVLIFTHITILGVTIFLHRSQTHSALTLHPIVNHFFRFWLWLSTGMETKAWVAIHRKHHSTCETEEDPHSPIILGIKEVLFKGAELYRREAVNQETLDHYGRGTPDDWLERNIYTPYSAKGVLVMLIANLFLFGIPGITIWAVQMMWIPFFAAGVINGVAHYVGYRNFEVPDESRNISPIGLLIGGEEMHNNHHTYPQSAKFSVKWWEFDIGWFYIKLLTFLRLAKVNRVPPKPHRTKDKISIDADTLTALVANRFQVMARYSKDVLMPVFHEEKQKAGISGSQLFRRAKTLLVREDSLVDEQGKERLNQVLEDSEALKLVYQYRMKLQDIWQRSTATQIELLEALQEWCRQAEEAGIEVLREFVARLKTYTMASA